MSLRARPSKIGQEPPVALAYERDELATSTNNRLAYMKKIAALLAFLWSSSVFACGCSTPRSPDEVQSYVHVFRGRVVDVVSSTEFGYPKQIVNFSVLEKFKGPSMSKVVVEFGGSTSCDLEKPNFVVGQNYLISDHHLYQASQQPKNVLVGGPLHPSGRFTGNLCSLRELVSTAPGK